MRGLTTGLLACLLTASTRAQGPASEKLSAAAVADSQAVLRTIDKQLRRTPDDAALWYRRGMVAWALSERARAPGPPRGIEWTSLHRMADSSLRIATTLDKHNAVYRAALGRVMLNSAHPTVRVFAPGQFTQAYAIARDGPDAALHAAAAIDIGRVHWRAYDALKDRHMRIGDVEVERTILNATQNVVKNATILGTLANLSMPVTGGAVDFDAVATTRAVPLASLSDVRDMLKQATMPLPVELNGARDYEKASAEFREAYAFAPMSARAFHAVAMVLADSSRWVELEAFARQHLASYPWDFPAWMTLGLALHREDKGRGARAAFDSAMAYIVPEERARLTDLARIMPPDARPAFHAMSADAQRSRTIGFWLGADPLWTQEGREPQIEFLSRVWYAELRWSVDELKIRGADTDRGDVFVRYGRPDEVVVIGPRAIHAENNAIVTYWLYDSGLIFSFHGLGTFATAYTPPQDVALAETFKAVRPYEFASPGLKIDSMPAISARFRGGADSVDLFVAMRPAYDTIRAASIVSEPVLAAHWILGNDTRPVYGDTARIRDDRVLSYTHRVTPGDYLYRAEVSSTGASRSGRVMAMVAAKPDTAGGFALRGFGMSDLLLATRADTPKPRARWTSTNLSPLVGGAPRGSTIEIVWENYELGQRDSVSQYEIGLTIDRDHSASGRLAVRFLGIPDSLARVDRKDNRVTLRFDRTAQFAPAFADKLDVALGETPIGSYTITLEVRDRLTGRATSRTSAFVVRQ